jgi:hypothetical protein
MPRKSFVRFALFVAIVSNAGCQHSLANHFVGAIDRSPRSGATSSSTSTAPSQIVDKEYVAYRETVREKFLKRDFVWIDREAHKVRLSKERLPGGYWKLRAVYDALEKPALEDKSSDGDWEDLLKGLELWSKQQTGSVTAKVALASAWEEYAWKARGKGYADSVSDTSWEVFHKRLDSARQALSEASSLDERCPYWFLTALWVGIGQGWDRGALDKIFDAGVQLEPTFYYLYQTKATYLLPRWRGTKGEWEKFADDAALRLGGNQGDIIFFAIYSQMLSLDGMIVMNNHQQVVPKLLAGYHSIEKLYGSSTHRLNEACFFATFGNDLPISEELFARVGDDYDETVWHSKQNYDVFRQGTKQRAKSSSVQTQNAARSASQMPKN